MKVIAHRGACREELENSWAAFNRAVEIGADRIELDIVLTADNHVIVMHDLKLDRTTGQRQSVANITRADTEKIRLLNGDKIPFLDEVVAEFLPKIELNIEIKGDSIDLADRAAKIVVQSGLAEKVIFSSFNLPPLEHLAAEYPDLRRACLVGPIHQWPNFGHQAPPVFMNRVRSRIIHPWTGLVTEGFMDQARARKWIVYPYCEMQGEEQDREGLWTYLKTLGIDGLCTNYPREFKAWLETAERYDTASAQF